MENQKTQQQARPLGRNKLPEDERKKSITVGVKMGQIKAVGGEEKAQEIAAAAISAAANPQHIKDTN